MEPKTARSCWLVGLPPGDVALLTGLKVRQPKERQALGMDWKESDHVFSRLDGSPVDSDTIFHAFADIIKEGWTPSCPVV